MSQISTGSFAISLIESLSAEVLCDEPARLVEIEGFSARLEVLANGAGHTVIGADQCAFVTVIELATAKPARFSHF
jgi:hypothetical protein